MSKQDFEVAGREGESALSIVSVYLPEWIIEELKKRGIENRSALVKKLLEDFLEGIHVSSYTIQQLREEISRLEASISALKAHLKELEQRKSLLEEKLKEEEELYRKIETSKKVAAIISEINEILVAMNFDVDAAWPLCEALCAKLTKLGYSADKKWLEEQAKRLRLWS